MSFDASFPITTQALKKLARQRAQHTQTARATGRKSGVGLDATTYSTATPHLWAEFVPVAPPNFSGQANSQADADYLWLFDPVSVFPHHYILQMAPHDGDATSFSKARLIVTAVTMGPPSSSIGVICPAIGLDLSVSTETPGLKITSWQGITPATDAHILWLAHNPDPPTVAPTQRFGLCQLQFA